jgi:hypothetical protein
MAGLGLGGCQLLQLPAYMARSAERQGSREVLAEYTGLTGKSFAVVVSADMFIQAETPAIVSEVSIRVAERLREFAGASAYIPGQTVLGELFQRPDWTSMTRAELAKYLGVQRLVFVEISEYRLRDRGNSYLYSARASGWVSVYEADGRVPEEAAFRKAFSVKFPSSESEPTDNLNEFQVNSILLKRVVDRVSWLFYKHEEPNIIDY